MRITTSWPVSKKSCHARCQFHQHYTYECCFGSFFYSYVYVEKATETTFVRKIRTYNVDEIDGRSKVKKLFYKEARLKEYTILIPVQKGYIDEYWFVGTNVLQEH